MISTEKRPAPLLLGHRGASQSAPENTLQAFDLALAHGCDGFELDVRATRDGRAILCHDPELLGLSLAACDYGQLAQRKKTTGGHPVATIPCLEDVLARYPQQVFLDVELKAPGLEQAVAEQLGGRDRQRTLVSSFLSEVLEAMHRVAPGTMLGWICDERAALPRWRKIAAEVLVAHFLLIDRELMEAAHDSGKQVFVWTVNHRDEMLRCAEMGADGIISDDTKLLGSVFRERRG